MKRALTILVLALICVGLGAAEPVWLTDFPKAQAQARADKKLILLHFTGSDW